MSKYIKTPEERRMSFIRCVLHKFSRERALKERVESLERENGILKQRLERERERKLF
ncbi:hypothetical protein KAR91_44130 [Candidatus Pacearchaeota archaeon]|nr:hypothetical protein [Candidatus Pacearchaeota archaeon]